MKISVVVPVYNCAGYIEKCIDSLLCQKGAEVEIVIINDGSTDNVLDILTKYKDKIKLFSIENGGVANARNLGLANATGDFVAFLDSDDALSPECFETIVAKQEKTNADIVRFGYCIVYPDGTTKHPLSRFDKEEFVEKKDFIQKIYRNYIDGIRLNSICMTIFRREIIQDLVFRKNMQTAEDALFSMQAYTRAERVLLLPDEYYLYWQSENGLTGKGLSGFEKLRCNFIMSVEIMKMLPKWRMNRPIWYIKALMRNFIIVFDKLQRIRSYKKN